MVLALVWIKHEKYIYVIIKYTASRKSDDTRTRTLKILSRMLICEKSTSVELLQVLYRSINGQSCLSKIIFKVSQFQKGISTILFCY